MKRLIPGLMMALLLGLASGSAVGWTDDATPPPPAEEKGKDTTSIAPRADEAVTAEEASAPSSDRSISVEQHCAPWLNKIQRINRIPVLLRAPFIPQRGYLEHRHRQCILTYSAGEYAFLSTIDPPPEKPSMLQAEAPENPELSEPSKSYRRPWYKRFIPPWFSRTDADSTPPAVVPETVP